jgi:hypothetical protein
MSASQRNNGYEQLKAWCAQGWVHYPTPAQRATPAEADRFWEELHYYQPGQLDELLKSLTGHEAFNTTKEAALKKLRPLLLTILGRKEFTDPEFIRREQRRNVSKRERSVLPEDEETGIQSTEESPMSTVEIKSTTKKSAVKKGAVKKPDVKALKKANPVTTKSIKEPRRGRPGAYSEAQKITLLTKENPHREGTETFTMFGKIQKCKTVGDFLSKGGTPLYLRWFVNHDEVSVK